ncbi:hypothetical protein DFJ43DRAFT_1043968 [Lentinula guzmanii]|nr:hypothetical protein DFJ43DRAFT_1043968 [Lentinula guzmanii]
MQIFLLPELYREYTNIHRRQSKDPFSVSVSGPDDMIRSNRLLVAEGRRPDVLEQPGRSAPRRKGQHHLIPCKGLIDMEGKPPIAISSCSSGTSICTPPGKGGEFQETWSRGRVLSNVSLLYTPRLGRKQDLTPERKGTLHIVPCWTQQGHPLHTMTPQLLSLLMECATAALENFYSQGVELHCSKKAHEAGRCIYPFRKLRRGFMDLLDIGTRLEYGPGALIAGYLELALLLGGVGVNYFPTDAFHQLHDKSGGWGRRTLYGRLEDPEEVDRGWVSKRA